MQKQHGSAIIVALFITALVAASAIAMMSRASVDTYRATLLLNDMQANLYAEGAVVWAKDVLIQNAKLARPGQVTEKFPVLSPVNKINGATIFSILYDAAGRLNLNDLTTSQYQAVFTQLAADNTKKLAQAVNDWIIPAPKNADAYDNYYAKQRPSYRSSHQAMVSASELRMVQGVTPELYSRLSPSIIALPEVTQVNINSADLPVLMSLSPKVTLSMAKAIDARRRQTPFNNTQDFMKFGVVQNSGIIEDIITVTSNYFLLATHVMIGEQNSVIYTLLKRTTNSHSQPEILILWQSRNTL